MKAKSSIPQVKHIPKRTCIGCNRTTAKRELVRLVCDDEGNLVVDNTGKKSGRGAYLCPNRICWEKALKSGRLSHALRRKFSAENIEMLINYARGFDNAGSNT
jgi:uncharacterized protein